MHRVLTANPVSQRLSRAVGTIVLALTLAVAWPGPAQASVTECAWSQPPPRSCISVSGTPGGPMSLAGGVNLAPRQTATGRFHLWGQTDSRRFDLFTGTATYSNRSSAAQTIWGRRFVINQPLSGGSRVCAQFIDSRLGPRTEACVRLP